MFSFNKKEELVEEILDYSILPTEEQMEQLTKDMYELTDYNKLPFWNVKTGELVLGHLGSVKGVLLSNPMVYADNLNAIKKYPGRNKFYVNKLVQLAQQNRLQALCDIVDMPEEVNVYKLASQLINGVFLEQEVQYKSVIDMVNILLENADYEVLLRVLNSFSVNFLSSLALGIQEYNIDFIGFLTLELEKNPSSELSAKTLILLKKFSKNNFDVIDDISSALYINTLDRIIENKAWDAGDGTNLKVLDGIIDGLQNNTFVITDDSLELLLTKDDLITIVNRIDRCKETFLKRINSSKVTIVKL